MGALFWSGWSLVRLGYNYEKREALVSRVGGSVMGVDDHTVDLCYYCLKFKMYVLVYGNIYLIIYRNITKE